jgi:hypothetical protein
LDVRHRNIRIIAIEKQNRDPRLFVLALLAYAKQLREEQQADSDGGQQKESSGGRS